MISRKEFLRILSASSVCAAWPLGPLLADSWPPRPFKPGPYRRFKDSADYLRRKFREDVTDPTTGQSNEAIIKSLEQLAADLTAQGEAWPVVKARLFATICSTMSIDVSPLDRFPAIGCWNRWARPLRKILDRRCDEILARSCPSEWNEAQARGREGWWLVGIDFDHSAPDWDVILTLGFGGLSRRLDRYRRDTPRWRALRITMDATLATLTRFAELGRKNGCLREAVALEHIRDGAPGTAYEGLLFIWVYFFLGEHIDHMQVRSLSHLDYNLRPLYEADLAAGRTTEAEFKEDFRHFLWQWGSVDNYWGQPVYMGGSLADGSTVFCDFSRVLLEVFDECALPTPKLQLKVSKSTPEWVWNKAADMARRHRSIAFMGEEGIFRAMISRGYSREESLTAAIWGCYEFAPRHHVNGTAPAYVSVLKPIELMLEAARRGSFAAATFADFKQAYFERVTHHVSRAMAITRATEKNLEAINPGNLFTIAMEEALKNGRDAFANGLEKGNETYVLENGLGTAVDALLAIKELVYEKRELTLVALGELMATNWQGRDDLRLRMRRSKRKWGNNDVEANTLGREISKCFASLVNGQPNSRGGKYFVCGHSARQHIELAAHTAATPDGRKSGEEMSKNLSPTPGADTEGITALVETLRSIDVEDVPNDMPLDVMMHPSAAEGPRGLEAIKSIVRVYHALGGTVIQFNIVSAEELRDAQAHPERYENLQIRVCGWNVRWNDIPKVEQDEYIRRAECIQQ